MVFADQIIKVFIFNICMDPHVHIVFFDNVLYFCPMQNTQGFNIVITRLASALFDVDISHPPFALQIGLVIFVAGLTLFAALYFVYVSKEFHRFIYCYLLFMIVGTVCRLIDAIFWGGSIDYIGLFDWFIFDLKDVYITAGGTFAVLALIRYLRAYYKLDKEERKQQGKGFWAWMKKGCR